jgi:CCR4-NOT transcription complex subunit 7/8
MHEEHGIDVLRFGEVLTTSGIVLNDDVRWVSFHSGYDFGYLVKLLINKPLPVAEDDFFDLLRMYFPGVYDVKCIMQDIDYLKGGLNHLAETLQVARIGPEHQAGSDSLLTAATFFKLKKEHFGGSMDDKRFLGILYGFGSDEDGRNTSYYRNNPLPEGVKILGN